MQPVTVDDHALKLAMFNELTDAYETGNPKEDHYLNFNGGVQAVKKVLEARIGKPYGDAYVFVGFRFQLNSWVEKVVPAEGEAPVNNESVEDIDTTSETIAVKLFPWEPWLNIAQQDRTNPSETELYDLFVTAYIRLKPVQYYFGSVEITATLQYLSPRWPQHIDSWPMDSKSWKVTEFDDFSFPIPMAKDYAKAVAFSLEKASTSLRYEHTIADDNSALSLRAFTTGKKQDGIWRWLCHRARSPHYIGGCRADVYFLIKIFNPEKKLLTVRFDFSRNVTYPSIDPYYPSNLIRRWFVLYDFDVWHMDPDTVPDLSSHIFDYLEKPDEASGSVEYQSQETLITLYVIWECHLSYGDRDRGELNNLLSEYALNKSLEIKVLGL